MFTITIMPDFGDIYCWWSREEESEHKLSVGTAGSLPQVRVGTKKRSNPLEPAFDQWYAEFVAIPFNPDAWAHYDWRSFHREGIRLSRKLKRQLGEGYRVIYEKPTEDPNFWNNERREVQLDGTLTLLKSRAEIKDRRVSLPTTRTSYTT